MSKTLIIAISIYLILNMSEGTKVEQNEISELKPGSLEDTDVNYTHFWILK